LISRKRARKKNYKLTFLKHHSTSPEANTSFRDQLSARFRTKQAIYRRFHVPTRRGPYQDMRKEEFVHVIARATSIVPTRSGNAEASRGAELHKQPVDIDDQLWENQSILRIESLRIPKNFIEQHALGLAKFGLNGGENAFLPRNSGCG